LNCERTRAIATGGNTVATIAARVRAELADRPAVIVADGPHSIDEATAWLASVAGELGTAVEPLRASAGSAGSAVELLEPASDRIVDGRALTETLHTDGADRRSPPGYTFLHCLTPDEHGGGASIVCDLERMRSIATAGGHLSILTSSLPWKLAKEDGGGIWWAPALDLGSGTLRWVDPEVALDWTALALPFHEPVRRWAARLASLGRHDGLPSPMLLHAGELLVIDNRRAMHARSAIADPATSERRMLRVRVH
jgi:hypothetical protein